MELKKELEKLRDELEQKANNKNEKCKILDIQYYKEITFDDIEANLYLVEEETNGQVKRYLQVGDKVIADIGEDNAISMRSGLENKSLDILIKLRDIEPISLKKLEIIEQNKKTIENKEEGVNSIGASCIAEINLNERITETKTFSDLVPEIKEKQIQKVKVRRISMVTFEFYGEGKHGEYIPIESLKQVEGTNPNKDINEVNRDGSKVEKNQVYSMFQIEHGTNEQNGNEGFTIDLEDITGIPEVTYYRRSRNNEYTSIPVNLKNTNQKWNESEVREYAEKEINPEVSDNIKRTQDILEEQEETSLENIDDDLNNDIPETRREYEEKLIEEAAKRCKMSIKGFKELLEQERRRGEPIEKSIQRAEDEVNEQVMGRRNR